MKTVLRARSFVSLVALPCLLAASACEDPSTAGGAQAGDGTDAQAPTPTSDAGATAPACTPSGPPVTHTGDITASETWKSGIHLVPSTLRVRTGAHLTVEGCTEVRLGADASIVVDATASGIDTRGTSSSTVTFHRDAPASAWGSLWVTTPATATLAYTTFDGGGGTRPHGHGAEFEGATLVAKGDSSQSTIPVVLNANHVEVTGSTGIGIFLQSARFDPTSTKLTVRGAGWFPVYGGIASAASLPDGSYVGNADDRILLQTISAAVYDDGGALSMDATLHDRGLPYLVGTTSVSIRIGNGLADGPPALLTIEPNVSLLFTPQGAGGRSQILVSGHPVGDVDAAQGALVVLGTPSAPVTFASAAAAPAPGDWQGLYFAGIVDPRTNVAGARILDAGGNSGTVGVCESAPGRGTADASCAVVVSVSSPPHAFLHDSSILDSANCGVYRGWRASDVELAASNQFIHVPGCIESNVPDIHNSCPTTACPTAP